jgi:hypothetical protein
MATQRKPGLLFCNDPIDRHLAKKQLEFIRSTRLTYLSLILLIYYPVVLMLLFRIGIMVGTKKFSQSYSQIFLFSGIGTLLIITLEGLYKKYFIKKSYGDQMDCFEENENVLIRTIPNRAFFIHDLLAGKINNKPWVLLLCAVLVLFVYSLFTYILYSGLVYDVSEDNQERFFSLMINTVFFHCFLFLIIPFVFAYTMARLIYTGIRTSLCVIVADRDLSYNVIQMLIIGLLFFSPSQVVNILLVFGGYIESLVFCSSLFVVAVLLNFLYHSQLPIFYNGLLRMMRDNIRLSEMVAKMNDEEDPDWFRGEEKFLLDCCARYGIKPEAFQKLFEEREREVARILANTSHSVPANRERLDRL